MVPSWILIGVALHKMQDEPIFFLLDTKSLLALLFFSGRQTQNERER